MDSAISGFSSSISSGLTQGGDASALLAESELNDATSVKNSDDFGSKRYLIFDQTHCGSRRIFLHPHDGEILSTSGIRCDDYEVGGGRRMRYSISESASFQETVALGIAAFEHAKAARAFSSPLWSFGPPCASAGDHSLFVKDGESEKLMLSESDMNDPCYSHEDTQELDALLNSEDEVEDEDEVTSTLTLSDGAYDTGSSDERLEFDICGETSRKRMRSVEYIHCKEKSVHFESAWGESERESIKKKLKVLGSMVGGGCLTTTALLDEAIHFVKNLQHQRYPSSLKKSRWDELYIGCVNFLTCSPALLDAEKMNIVRLDLMKRPAQKNFDIARYSSVFNLEPSQRDWCHYHYTNLKQSEL